MGMEIIVDSADLRKDGPVVYHRETIPLSVANKLGITRDGKFDYGEHVNKQVFEECRRIARHKFCDKYQPHNPDNVSFIREEFEESKKLSSNETRVYSVTVGAYNLGKKVDVQRETYRFFVKFFKATPDAVEAREKERRLGQVFNDAGVMLRCSDKVKQVLIYDFLEPSLGDQLETLGYTDRDRSKRRELLGQALDRIIDLDDLVLAKYKKDMREELAAAGKVEVDESAFVRYKNDKLRELGVADLDIKDDIGKFFRCIEEYSGVKLSSDDLDSKKLLEDRITSVLGRSRSRLVHGDAFQQNFLIHHDEAKNVDEVLVNDPEKAAFGPVEYDIATLVVGLNMPYRDKVDIMINDAYDKLAKKYGSSVDPKWLFEEKVDSAIIGRGLRIIGYYVQLFWNPKYKHKRKQISASMERMFTDVLYSAKRINERKKGGEAMRGGATYTAIIGLARKYLSARNDFSGYMNVESVVGEFTQGKNIMKGPSLGDKAIDFTGRHPGAVGGTVLALLITAATAVALSRPRKPVDIKPRQQPASRPTQKSKPVYYKGPIIKDFVGVAQRQAQQQSPEQSPQQQQAPEPVKPGAVPRYSQLPGKEDGSDPLFCRKGYALSDDKKFCLKDIIPSTKGCDEGYKYSSRRGGCVSQTDRNTVVQLKPKCPDGYDVDKTAANIARCIRKKAPRR